MSQAPGIFFARHPFRVLVQNVTNAIYEVRLQRATDSTIVFARKMKQNGNILAVSEVDLNE